MFLDNQSITGPWRHNFISGWFGSVHIYLCQVLGDRNPWSMKSMKIELQQTMMISQCSMGQFDRTFIAGIVVVLLFLPLRNRLQFDPNLSENNTSIIRNGALELVSSKRYIPCFKSVYHITVNVEKRGFAYIIHVLLFHMTYQKVNTIIFKMLLFVIHITRL